MIKMGKIGERFKDVSGKPWTEWTDEDLENARYRDKVDRGEIDAKG